MKTNWIPTDGYYQRILAAPDAAARRQLYLDLLVEPWKPMMKPMMEMMGRVTSAMAACAAMLASVRP